MTRGLSQAPVCAVVPRCSGMLSAGQRPSPGAGQMVHSWRGWSLGETLEGAVVRSFATSEMEVSPLSVGEGCRPNL